MKQKINTIKALGIQSKGLKSVNLLGHQIPALTYSDWLFHSVHPALSTAYETPVVWNNRLSRFIISRVVFVYGIPLYIRWTNNQTHHIGTLIVFNSDCCHLRYFRAENPLATFQDALLTVKGWSSVSNVVFFSFCNMGHKKAIGTCNHRPNRKRSGVQTNPWRPLTRNGLK